MFERFYIEKKINVLVRIKGFSVNWHSQLNAPTKNDQDLNSRTTNRQSQDCWYVWIAVFMLRINTDNSWM